jgi:hypothetical protein
VDEACLDGKEEWGTHVAAHPCRPDWTRETVSAFHPICGEPGS